MGKETGIAWTDHTFSPWWGCTKVEGSPACEHCYAESFSIRTGYGPKPVDSAKFPIWGAYERRRFFGDQHWRQPVLWDKAARNNGKKTFVFCASMGDWAEGRPDQRASLERLWRLQAETPNLVWLMLTKRPQLINKLCPAYGPEQAPAVRRRWHGVTAETQAWLDLRWERLRDVISPVYWLSMEPLFERIQLPDDFLSLGRRAWVIAGGESGGRARPMDPTWPRYLRDQCQEAGVPFFFKQWGEWSPEGRRIGVKDAGNILDGRQWLERPEATW
jgi:protein gp37